MKFLNINILLVLIPSITMFITACSYDVKTFSPITRATLLKHPDGSMVVACDGGGIQVGDWADRFWKENNLPKGTIDFVCVEGKAYLKGQEPKP